MSRAHPRDPLSSINYPEVLGEVASMATKRQEPLPDAEWRKRKRPATRQACEESPEPTQAQSPQVTPELRSAPSGGGLSDVNTVDSNWQGQL